MKVIHLNVGEVPMRLENLYGLDLFDWLLFFHILFLQLQGSTQVEAFRWLESARGITLGTLETNSGGYPPSYLIYPRVPDSN